MELRREYVDGVDMRLLTRPCPMSDQETPNHYIVVRHWAAPGVIGIKFAGRDRLRALGVFEMRHRNAVAAFEFETVGAWGASG